LVGCDPADAPIAGGLPFVLPPADGDVLPTSPFAFVSDCLSLEGLPPVGGGIEFVGVMSIGSGALDESSWCSSIEDDRGGCGGVVNMDIDFGNDVGAK
jgi:hypothetical protein